MGASTPPPAPYMLSDAATFDFAMLVLQRTEIPRPSMMQPIYVPKNENVRSVCQKLLNKQEFVKN